MAQIDGADARQSANLRWYDTKRVMREIEDAKCTQQTDFSRQSLQADVRCVQSVQRAELKYPLGQSTQLGIAAKEELLERGHRTHRGHSREVVVRNIEVLQ